MRLTVPVKLLPTPAQAAALESTLRACNSAASDVAAAARTIGCYRNYDLRKYTYQAIKTHHLLGAQAAQHVIKKVADAYATLNSNIQAGHLGKPGSKRRCRAETNTIEFRWNAAQPYDVRMLSWQRHNRTVSIWTVAGRLKNMAYTGSAHQLNAIATSEIGESDLVYRDGMWFLYASVEVAEESTYEPDGFLGVDLGIANIAYDSDGNRHSGSALNGYRRRQARLRARLQHKGSKSARRLLARRRKKEARHATNINHHIAKTIVTEAERTGRGIAVENLTGIRDRVRLRKPQRVTLHSWAFHQLGSFLTYKARRAGVPLVHVDPRQTSQICHSCGHLDKRNRPNQETFVCRSCRVVAHADHNAALNIAKRGFASWGAVNRPHAAPPCSQPGG